MKIKSRINRFFVVLAVAVFCGLLWLSVPAQAEEALTLDSIAWESYTYRDLFETYNQAYTHGFDHGDFGSFYPYNGTNYITNEACVSQPYSLAAFGSKSQRLIAETDVRHNGEYFIACKAWCVRYTAGELGVSLKDTVAGVSAVTEGFETVSAIAEASVGYSVCIGSTPDSDLDGYVDDPVVVDMDIFKDEPSLEELTALYETYLQIVSTRVHAPSSVTTLPAKAPSLTAPGLTEGRSCELCGVIEPQQEVPALQAQQSLPAGYTKLAYLDSSGGAYIDTDMAGTTEDRFVLWGKSIHGDGHHLMGAGSGLATNDSVQVAYTTLYKIRFFRKAWGDLSYPADSPMCFILDLNSNEGYINGTNCWSGGFRSAPSTLNIYLFAKNVGGVADLISDTRIYRYQHYRMDKLIRDMVPCVQDSTGVYGLYDLVEGKFYTNAGSGSFTGSAEIQEHTYYACTVRATCYEQGYTTYTCIACGDSYTSDETSCAHALKTLPAQMPTEREEGYTQHEFCILCGEVTLQSQTMPARKPEQALPEGYVLVDSILGSGKAYIDTGLTAEKQDKLIVYGTVPEETGNSALFGAQNGYSKHVTVRHNSSGFYIGVDGQNSKYMKVPCEEPAFIMLDLENSNGFIQGLPVYKEAITGECSDYNIWLFGSNISGKLLSNFVKSCRIYRYQHYRSGVLLRDMVPCYSTAEGVYGMYDLVEGKFYTNDGKGTLTGHLWSDWEDIGTVNCQGIQEQARSCTTCGAEEQRILQMNQYRWETQGDAFVSVTGEGNVSNAPTIQTGSIVDGTMMEAYFQLEKPINLYHDQPWVIEWTMEGTCLQENGTSGSSILAAYATHTQGPILYRGYSVPMLTFREYKMSSYHNYGISFKGTQCDLTVLHTYRLENVISSDGSNMAVLYIDGVRIGTMDHYFISTTSKNTTVDWINGRDLVFSFIATSRLPLTNCKLHSLQVWETGRDGHNDTAVTVKPTCETPGYTTYTCKDCGSVQRGKLTDPLGHNIVADKAVIPGITTPGYTEGSHCSRCKEVVVEQVEIPAIYDGSPLPEEYIRVDYLDSNGKAYIDTGLAPTQQDTFILYGYSLKNGNHRMMGCGSDVSSTDRLLMAWNEENGYAVRYNGQSSGYIPIPKKKLHCFIVDYPSNASYIDSAWIFQSKYVIPGSIYPVFLFGYNAGGALPSSSSYTGNTRIYGYKHYRDGVLLRNMVPVFHTETGEYGMYDFVESKFYTNKGEGKLHYELTGKHSFTQTVVSKTCTRNGYTLYSCADCGKSYADKIIPAGHTSVVTPATLPTLDQDGMTEGRYCTVCETTYVPRQIIPAPYSGTGLPQGYTYVEYLESVGDAYIDTGIAVTEADQIWLYALADYNDTHALMGSGSFLGSRDSVRILYTKGSGYSVQFQGGKSAAQYYPARDMLTFVLDFSNDIAFINGKAVYVGRGSELTNPFPIYLFSQNSAGQYDASQTGNTRIYGYRHCRNGELVRHMVPCRRDSDGEYGMYDLVEGKFYTNAGPGSLTHDPVDIAAGSAIVMNLETGEVYYEKNSSAELSMDHTAKLMTAILALEHLDLQARTEKTRGDDLLSGLTLGLRYGESLKVIDAMHGLMLTYGNDVAMVLAKTVAGSYDAFVSMMNEKAIDLGMLHTYYINPTGLADKSSKQEQFTTVQDSAILIRYAMENGTFRKLLNTAAYEILADKEGAKAHSLVNSNSFLVSYEGSIGGMNGSDGSHIQLASRHGTTLLAVLMNSNEANADQDANLLLDYGFSMAPEHNYRAEIILPTCTEDGYTVYSCPCGESYVADPVPATGHCPVTIPAQAPSCTEKGMTEGLCCGVCGENLQLQQTVPVLEHSWSDEIILIQPTQTQWGKAQYTCEVCSETKVQSIPPQEHIHSYETAEIAPTCTEAGFTVCACLCGDSYTISGESPLGHSVVTDPEVPAGCFTTGLTEGSHCGVCGQVLRAQKVTAETGHRYTVQVIRPTCASFGYSVYTCQCGDSFQDDYKAMANHTYIGGVCADCGKSMLGYDWRAPEFAEGDYTVVVIPDTQHIVERAPESFYRLTDWITGNAEALNIQAVMHLGDMVDDDSDIQWETVKRGMDRIDSTGAAWMPMRGNHDNSAMFNYYFDYSTYGTSRSWFGGSYTEGKLDHTYWFFTVGERQYMVLSLGWAPSWEVIDWAEELIKSHPDHNVILTCHAYMNIGGQLLKEGDPGCVNNTVSGSPEGVDIWARLKGYDNIVLGLGGHVSSNNLSIYRGTNGKGREVANILADAQNMDLESPVAMLLLMTFHEESDTVDLNWYSAEYDALYRESNQFSITVPHIHTHEFTSETVEPTCTEQGYLLHTCACGDSYRTDLTPVLGHSYDSVITPPGCTTEGFTTHTCFCGDSFIDDSEEPLGHTEVVDPGVEATCMQTGLTEGKRCSVCAQILVPQTETGYGDHVYGPWITTRKPDENASGEKIRFCNLCGQEQYGQIDNNPFTDVTGGNRFKKYILWAYYEGITAGKTATTFEPNADVTRGQFVTFLWRAAGEPEPESDVNPFTDVPDGKFYTTAVLWAYYEGITSGTSKTTFGPDNTCTRAQVVTFLYRYAGSPEVKNVENTFTDVTGGNRFLTAILWAKETGVTSGKTETTFDPNGTCTRAQVVTFLYRFMEKEP